MLFAKSYVFMVRPQEETQAPKEQNEAGAAADGQVAAVGVREKQNAVSSSYDFAAISFGIVGLCVVGILVLQLMKKRLSRQAS